MANDPWAGFPVVNSNPSSPTVGDLMSAPSTPTPAAQTLGTLPAAAPSTVGDLLQNPSTPTPAAQALGTLPLDSSGINLAMVRGRFAQELQNNPALMTKLMATTNAEVGGQGAEAQQALVESVLNRAAARGMTLDGALSQKAYWDPRTTAAQGRPLPQGVATTLAPIINNVISGSNVSNLATGNGSGPNVVFKSGGEPFVLEANTNDQRWAKGMMQIAQQTPTPAPTSVAGTPKLSPTELLTQYNKIASMAKPSTSVYQPTFTPYKPTPVQPLT